LANNYFVHHNRINRIRLSVEFDQSDPFILILYLQYAISIILLLYNNNLLLYNNKINNNKNKK